jgi:hypothetical protein
MVKRTGERFSWYCCENLRTKIELPSCRQYKPGDFLPVRPLNCDDIIKGNDDDDIWADTEVSSGGRSHPCDGNDNDDREGEGEEDTWGGARGTGKGKGKIDGIGTGKEKATEEGKGKWMGNSKGKDIVKQTTEGDDFSHAIAFQLQN